MAADVTQLISDLSASDPLQRIAAADQLQNHPQVAAATVALLHAMADDHAQVREFAASALEQIPPPADDALPAMVPLLESENNDVAYWAATLLGRAGARAAASAPALGHVMLNSTAPFVQQRCAWALDEMGAAAVAARNELRMAAASDDRRLARFAASALEKV